MNSSPKKNNSKGYIPFNNFIKYIFPTKNLSNNDESIILNEIELKDKSVQIHQFQQFPKLPTTKCAWGLLRNSE